MEIYRNVPEYSKCDECWKHYDKLIELGQTHPGGEGQFCTTCLRAALEMLEKGDGKETA